jgi:hypothetical protein
MDAGERVSGGRTGGRLAMLLVAVIAAVAVGGSALAQATESSSVPKDSSVTTDTVAGAAVPARSQAPTKAEIESVFAQARACLETAGIEVLGAKLSITQYDVSTSWILRGAYGGDLTPAEARIDADCRGDLSAIGTAWTAASGLPYDQLNEAIAECLAAEGVEGDAGSVASPADHGCVESARQSVLGISLGNR